MTDIKPELIEKASRLTDWSQHEYRVDSRTWIPSCVCGWTATEPYDVEGFDRHITGTVLATVADDLRAEGAAALREQLAVQVEALAPDLTEWRSDYRDGRAHMATEAAHTVRGGEQS